MAKRIIQTKEPTPELLNFIKSRHILTLATAIDNIPYCANCFYAFQKSDQVFIFTSDPDTRHIKEAVQNNKVALSIYLDTKVVGKIRGIQITGVLKKAEGSLLKNYKLSYLKRFPYAAASLSDIWYVKPDFAKFTDNRLGFGTKLIWEP